MAGKIAGGAGSGAPSYSPSDISRLEKSALDRANKAVSAIENAIALWEASPQKPQDIGLRVGRLVHFYGEITKWERKMLKSAGRKRDMLARIALLREFSDICHASA
ncbi:MAG: hypothetical protein WC350_05080 [Candidatus Micrarchaeia archaeon]|jgi:hypothetical protein